MRGSPVVIGLLVGLIVILVISGVSLVVKMNTMNLNRDEQLSEKRACEVEAQDLRSKNSKLRKSIDNLNIQAQGFRTEIDKLNEVKAQLEENLKEELMKKKTSRRKLIKE